MPDPRLRLTYSDCRMFCHQGGPVSHGSESRGKTVSTECIKGPERDKPKLHCDDVPCN